MSHITPEQFQAFMTLIMAIVSAIAAFVSAVKGGQARDEAKQARVEASTARAEVAATIAAGLRADAAPGSLPPGLSIADLFRYSGLIQEVLAVIKSIGRLTVGASALVPKVLLDLPTGEQIELAPTTATRRR